jgi:hypothetical protein
MNDKPTPRSHAPEAGPAPALSRRTLFAGAGTAGALAAAAALVPRGQAAPAVADGIAPAAQPDGYRLSEHVKRYYQTARV